jgi:L-phenylalanine/L-methionine N-acetyltransferase
MEEIEVRGLEKVDWPAVVQILNQPKVIWGTLEPPYVTLAEFSKRQASVPDRNRSLVAAIGGTVVGIGGIYPNDNPRRAHAAAIGMAVHDAYSGRGVGRAILIALLDLADTWLQCSRVELVVWADNRRAISLYEKFGFQKEGVFRNYSRRGNAYVDALSMARM